MHMFLESIEQSREFNFHLKHYCTHAFEMLKCSACCDDMSIEIGSAGLAIIVLASRDKETIDMECVAFEGDMPALR